MTYCIIGNSVAAVGAVEAIRTNDEKTPITIISNEPYHVYSRPLISYFLSGKVHEDKMYYRDKDFYTRNRVEILLGRNVTGVEPDKKAVILENNTKIFYDKLLIATGGKLIVPSVEGLDKEGVFSFATWDDAKKIACTVDKVKKAIVIGGGLIGLKAAEALKERGITVTVIELAERILSPIMDEIASGIVEKHLKTSGVNVITKNTVKEIDGKNSVKSVVLKDGQKVDCDIVITAIGVKPRLDVIRNTGITVNHGIVVNDQMETSVQGIFAAGDVAEGYDSIYRTNRVIPIWPNAYRQGYIAGSNMADLRISYSGGININSIELFNLPTITVGLVNSPNGGYEVVKKFDGEKKYRKVILKNNVLVGAIFIGCIDRAGILTGLIKDQVNIEKFKEEILEANFGYVSFPKELRMEKMK